MPDSPLCLEEPPHSGYGGGPIVTDNCTDPFISGNPISNSSEALMARKAWTKHSLMNSDLTVRGCLVGTTVLTHEAGKITVAKKQRCIPMISMLFKMDHLLFGELIRGICFLCNSPASFWESRPLTLTCNKFLWSAGQKSEENVPTGF